MNGDDMDDLPLVDPAQMERLVEWGGADLKKKMIDLFLAHAGERLDQVREGISTGLAEKAESGAHTLKSSAGNVGAKRVQFLAQEIESKAEEGKMEEVAALFPGLESEFEAACAVLKELMGGEAE